MNLEDLKTKFFNIPPEFCERNYQDIECLGFIGYSKSFETWDLIKDLVNWKGKTVVDIGCCRGYFCFKAEELGAKCIGLDSCPPALETANDIKDVTGSKVVFKVWTDTGVIPDCDITLCFSVLHHLKDKEAFIAKIHSELVIFKVNLNEVDLVKKYFDVLISKDTNMIQIPRKILLAKRKHE